ncbi:hypothetical protein ACVCH0_20790 [Burkholderia glumae]
MFTDAEAVATLSGDNKQVRRVANPQPEVNPHGNLCGKWLNHRFDGLLPQRLQDIVIHCPFGQPGDRLWVGESFRFTAEFDGDSSARVAEQCLGAGYARPQAPLCYEADGAKRDRECLSAPPGRLRPARHMPIRASRLLLTIVSIRVERLQSISESNARTEAAPSEKHHTRGYCAGESRPPSIRAFRDTWGRVHAAHGYAWDEKCAGLDDSVSTGRKRGRRRVNMASHATFEISAVSYEGLSVKTGSGEPGRLAVIDAHGNVVDASPEVARAAFDAAVRSYRNFLMGTGHLRVLAHPADRKS